tara:strand:- start:1554 stop:2000 length:447 start_codon:yes stop_codon:yes gene_type:complete
LYFKKKIKGFSLIELLVVVAILGVIASIGVVSYNGYVSSTKMKNTENIMRQVSLGQSEYYSLGGVYFEGTCPPNKASSKKVQNELLDGAKTIVDQDDEITTGYSVCVKTDKDKKFIIYAIETDKKGTKIPGGCELELGGDGSLKRTSC